MATTKSRTGFQKFYAFYLLFALLGPVTYVITYHTVLYSFEIPILVGFAIYGFYFLSGMAYWQSPDSRLAIVLVQAALFLQMVQFDFLGWKFKNYYGPTWRLGTGMT